MVEQKYIIDMLTDGEPVKVALSQHDKGTRKLAFTLMTGSEYFEIPAGYEPYLYGRKPDRKGFEVIGTADGPYTVSFVVTAQMTAAYGAVRAQVVLQDPDTEDRIGSAPIVIDVSRAGTTAEEIKDSDDYISIKQIIDTCAQAAAAAEAAKTAAQTAAETIPEVTITETEIGAEVTVTDSTGQTTTAQVLNGRDGSTGPQGERGPAGETGPAGPAGADGSDYVLTASDKAEIAGMAAQEVEPKIPTVTISETDTGAEVTITDGTGKTTTAQISNGRDGVDGSAGPAGPAGERGPQGERGPAGETGPAGRDGSDYVLTTADKEEIAGMAAQEVEPKIPTVTISETETGAEVTITDGTGQTTTAQILNGVDGSAGPAGPAGERGPQGEIGPQGPAGRDGSDYVLTASDKQDIATLVAAMFDVYDETGF